MTYCIKELGSYQVLHFEPWTDRGIVHGFTGADLAFKGEDLERDKDELCTLLDVEALVIPEQQHTDRLCITSQLPPPTELAARDGVLLKGGAGHRLAVGVKTADCLPVLFLGRTTRGAVHAGWRGLANGILKHAAEQFGDKPFEVVIGPAAGGDRYEVGSEVIEAIGSSAVAQPSQESGKYLLNLAATAREQLSGFSRLTACHIAPYCTIGDLRWHSHRRQGAARGSNLAFIAS